MPDVRVVIVDDEPLARKGLRVLVAAHPNCVIVGEARSGIEAVRVIRETAPDIVFLDIQLPSGDAFEVLARLPANDLPRIVFVTAFDDYAVRAFALGAADYLLKPYDAPRFRLALSRALSSRGQAGLADAKPPRQPPILLLRRAGHVHVVAIQDIAWVEAADNYVRIHSRGGQFMMRKSLQETLASLAPHGFAQSHRSTLINLVWVHHLEPKPGGESRIHLADGTELTLSRAHRDAFRRDLAGT